MDLGKMSEEPLRRKEQRASKDWARNFSLPERKRMQQLIDDNDLVGEVEMNAFEKFVITVKPIRSKPAAHLFGLRKAQTSVMTTNEPTSHTISVKSGGR
jgi:hypothetical protein